MANGFGDVELSAEGMRALAHPVRLRVLTRLREGGPATATQLSVDVGASPSVTSWHLRLLAKYDLVSDVEELGRGRERYWKAAPGFRYNATDPASREAAGLLQQALDDEHGDVIGDWRRDTAPRLEQPWWQEAVSTDTTVSLTVEELARLNRQVEELLTPFVTRERHPAHTRRVRIVRHTMPEAES